MMIEKPVKLELPEYLKWIRKQECCNCGREPSPDHPIVPHHEIGVGDGKEGSKAGDDRAMPLCAYPCHEALHNSTGRAHEHWIMAQAGWIRATQDRWLRETGIKLGIES